MTDTTQTAVPSLTTLGQYIKDFSFENPNAPASLGPRSGSPEISITINVNSQVMEDGNYLIELTLDGKATESGTAMFLFELVYAGLFRPQNIPAENLQALMMIEGPRLLFPFARQIVADAVRDGGFPPLLIDPIDFASLYRQRLSQIEPVGNA